MRTILSALLIGVAAQAPVTRDTALFYGVDQCLAVTDKQQLNVGFLSKDGGETWSRLSTNVGFERIWWIAEALRPGTPRTFAQYLYTHH